MKAFCPQASIVVSRWACRCSLPPGAPISLAYFPSRPPQPALASSTSSEGCLPDLVLVTKEGAQTQAALWGHHREKPVRASAARWGLGTVFTRDERSICYGHAASRPQESAFVPNRCLLPTQRGFKCLGESGKGLTISVCWVISSITQQVFTEHLL